jgi:hypothetical protein
MEILPVVQLIEQDLPLEEENEDSEEESITETVEEDIMPTMKEKPTIPEEDIFVEKKVDKPVKKKRQMSEAQKENLKKGREKALAVRRAKAEEKRKMKELENKEKELVKKAKVKRVQKLEEEVSEAPTPRTLPPPSPQEFSFLQGLDPDLIRKLQQDAIEGYERVRKTRKAQKKKEEEEQKKNQHTANIINNALNPPKSAKYGEAGFFNHLF